MFKAYHAYLQKTTNLQSVSKNACMKVYMDLIDWWKRTGKALMSKPAIIDKTKGFTKIRIICIDIGTKIIVEKNKRNRIR